MKTIDSEATTRDLDDTAWMEGAPPAGDGDLPTRTREALLPTPRFILSVREGPERGREIELSAGRVSVGRSERAAIRIDDPSISRIHLWVEPRAEGVLIHGESTKNGTLLDGDPLLEGMAGEGQRLTLGQTVLEVRRADAGGGRPPGVVAQAFRLMRGAPPEGPRSPPRRRTILLCTGILGLAIAVVALRSPAPSVALEEAGPSPEERAWSSFEAGVDRLREGAFEEARPLFLLAGREDPESEEPGRYLSWLDAREEEAGVDIEEEGAGSEGEEGASVAEVSEEELSWAEVSPEEVQEVPPPSPRVRRAAPRPRSPRRAERAAAAKEEARQRVERLLERARSEDGSAAIASLREAWEAARGLREKSLEGEVRETLAARAFAAAEDAYRLGRLSRAVSHYKLALEASPRHEAAGERLASLQASAEAFLVEGYSLRERDPPRSREWLELVLALTDARDPLHQRAQKWLPRPL